MGPEIVKVLAEVHKLKAPGEGYGGWGLNRNGPFKSWEEYLLKSLEQDQSEFEDKSFYDADLQENLKEEIKNLIHYCPEERAILHGDFGTPNILSDGRVITAVIDWGDSLYGDPLKDIASLRPSQQEEFRRYYEERGGLPDNFDKRLECYTLLNAYGGLWFYAYSDQEESYKRCAQTANRLLEELKLS